LFVSAAVGYDAPVRDTVPSLPDHPPENETMATVTTPQPWRNGYPTSDGKPMAETDDHRDLMNALIETLKAYFAGEPMVYVSGNLLLFYVPGNKRRHLSPDVFVVRGVPNHNRPNYLLWEEGRGPQFVIELRDFLKPQCLERTVVGAARGPTPPRWGR
jgi:hypothetical protein